MMNDIITSNLKFQKMTKHLPKKLIMKCLNKNFGLKIKVKN